jgi:two-component system, OmpR family, sensor histidine kinase VicK
MHLGLAQFASSIGIGAPIWLLVALFMTIAAALALAAWVVVLLRHPRTAAPSAAEAELEILWQAMDAHAMVNISDAEGRIVYVNETFVKVTGYSRKELIGHCIPDFLLTEEANDAGTVRDVVSRGATWLGETQFRRKDGSLFWTRSTVVALRDSRGRIVRTVSLRTDITESKLRQAEAQSRALLDALRDEVYMITPGDLRLLYLNRQARAFHGWSESDYKTKTMHDAADDTFDEAAFRDRIKPLLAGEVEVLTYEGNHFGMAVEICLQLEKAFDGQAYLLAVVRDITHRKEVEAARTAFVATVSHELRSPLTSVMGALKLITAGAFGAMPEKPSALLDVALRNVDRVVLMINDLLDLEKLDAGKMEITLEPTDLSAVIEEAVAANTSYAEELGVSFRCSGTERPRMIEGNHARMIQVLNNLLSNAAKFSRPGGVVEVELRDRADGLQVLVKDTGVGIPKEAHARLFERFAQAGAPVHAGRRGTGLGLSIAKAIVEHHGGAIRFTSEVGVGTTFWIDLPKQSVLLGAA